ncbi:MAG: hypothetical protein VKL39_15375 [Leptolyngbyaceae bacterium]|nr:hypothetical protein [Leptolyngbyaceae bacterium]
MTNPSPEKKDLEPFGKLLSLLALLAAALYFTGWTYRWAYYDFFQVEVTTLDLPFESFYFASFQVLFCHPLSVLRTVGALAITGLAIVLVVELRQQSTNWIRRQRRRSFVAQFFPKAKTFRLITDLTDELIVVLLTLTTLFWIARWQAQTDAWRDAVNETSTLPIVTIVTPEEAATLGRAIDNPLLNPSELRVIGDQGIYNQLLGKELTDTTNPNEPRVWRLLSDWDGYFYIFPALPRKDQSLIFPTLIIYESGDQLMILSPLSSEDNP